MILAWCLCAAGLLADGRAQQAPQPKDWHTLSNPEQVRVEHVALDLTVDFSTHTLGGTATLDFQRQPGCPDGAPLVLDTNGLLIESVAIAAEPADPRRTGRDAFAAVAYNLGPKDAIRGRALAISIPRTAARVRIAYRTTSESRALQWLEPQSTAGGKHPFLCTQSEAILARTWIPLQDTPKVRVTYEATIRVPPGLKALMSGDDKGRAGEAFRWEMPQSIPSYLIALVVGDLEYRTLGSHTGVYAEPPVIALAAAEFRETEGMFKAAETLLGPYRWGSRYNVVVMPPGFPYGGMENPKLTFVTPTIITGDRSLVSVIAHELVHSWSGNLVTNASWSDFWLNEGFTTYGEGRVVEALYGRDRAEMEALIGFQELQKQLKGSAEKDQILHVDLTNRDPDEMVNSIPYEKGALFLKVLEREFGRDRVDAFLRGYFEHFAFQSITTAEFEHYLRDRLFPADPNAARTIDVAAWLYAPGLPPGFPEPKSERLARVEMLAQQWKAGALVASALPAGDWTSHEWLRFLRALPPALPAGRMAELDRAFGLTASKNPEILDAWLLLAIQSDYQPASPRLELFLATVGRGKYVRPLYKALAEKDKAHARELFEKNKPFYHAVVQAAVARELGEK